jgi:hypothetical protein
MAQIFHRSTNTLSRVSIFGGVFILAAVVGVAMKVDRSPLNTRATLTIHQPVPFSHEHHVSGLGIDCRYCHTSVEKAAFAGIPPVQTCYNCHSQIWTNAALLAPVRDGVARNEPIRWARVHDLPDYVYFNHSIHVAKGIGCVSCHGRIDKMQLTYQHATLQMEWCIDCHRNPAQHIRPKSEIYNFDWVAPAESGGQKVLGPQLLAEYKVLDTATLTSCSTCHR